MAMWGLALQKPKASEYGDIDSYAQDMTAWEAKLDTIINMITLEPSLPVFEVAIPEWKLDNPAAVAAFGVAAAIIADDVSGVGVVDDPLAALAALVGLGITVGANWDYIEDKVSDALDVFISWSKPGVPTKEDGYVPPKNWNGEKVKNPNGPGSGYPDKNGNVWVPQDHKGTHAPHWDVQHPGGGHPPVYPK